MLKNNLPRSWVLKDSPPPQKNKQTKPTKTPQTQHTAILVDFQSGKEGTLRAARAAHPCEQLAPRSPAASISSQRV